MIVSNRSVLPEVDRDHLSFLFKYIVVDAKELLPQLVSIEILEGSFVPVRDATVARSYVANFGDLNSSSPTRSLVLQSLNPYESHGEMRLYEIENGDKVQSYMLNKLKSSKTVVYSRDLRGADTECSKISMVMNDFVYALSVVNPENLGDKKILFDFQSHAWKSKVNNQALGSLVRFLSENETFRSVLTSPDVSNADNLHYLAYLKNEQIPELFIGFAVKALRTLNTKF